MSFENPGMVTPEIEPLEPLELPKISLAPEGDDDSPDLTVVMSNKNTVESYRTRFYRSLIGKQLDQYEVVSFIGSGSMGGQLLNIP